MARRKLLDRKEQKVAGKTLLIAGEGPIEKAFLLHVSDLFTAKGLSVKVAPASGGSPLDVFKEAKSRKHADHDRYYALIDTDVPIDDGALSYARREQITIITSSPTCLECMLLKELGEKVKYACACDECKKQLNPMLKGKPTNKGSYKELLPKQTLQSFKHPAIKDLIALMENTDRKKDRHLVNNIQDALSKLKLFTEENNGTFSTTTKTAIKAFQKKKSIYESGEPSEGLLSLMKDEIRGI